MTLFPVVVGALITIPKCLMKGQKDLEIRGVAETMKTSALLRSTRIVWRVLGTRGNLLSHKIMSKTINKCWYEKNSHRSIMIIIAQDQARVGRKSDQQGVVQEIEI